MPEGLLGWSEAHLSDLAKISSGGGIPRTLLDGPFVLMGANGPIGTAKETNFGPGYLVGRVGAAGAVNEVEGRCWASDNTLTVVPSPTRSDYLFMGHLLRFLRPEQLATKNAQPLVTQTNLGALVAVIPDDLREQRRIAEILDTVDEAIRKTEEILGKLKQVKQGLLHDLLTRGIDDNGELRDPDRHPEQFKDSPLGRIPKAWSLVPISDACDEVFLGLTSKVDYVDDGGVPLVRASDIADNVLNLEGARCISHRQHRQLTMYRKAGRGDVLVSKSGSLGVCVLVETDGEFSIYESIIALQSGETLDSSFLLWLMRSGLIQRQLLEDRVGSTVGHLNLLRFRELLLVLPGHQEQAAIARRCEALESRLRDEARSHTKLLRLRQGLMEDLLTGRVRVTALLEEAAQ